jgi:hypothetical protein
MAFEKARILANGNPGEKGRPFFLSTLHLARGAGNFRASADLSRIEMRPKKRRGASRLS